MSTRVIASTVALSTALVVGIGYIYYRRQRQRQLKCESRLNRILAMLEADVNCHVKDPVALRSKLREIIDAGPASFQIITDFDHTLTSYWNENEDGTKKVGTTSFKVIQTSSQVGSTAGEKLRILYDKYYPLEISPTMSNEEKTPLMIEWYEKSFEVGISVGVKRDHIPYMVKESQVVLRAGMDELLGEVTSYQIPMLVASAGIGDIINEVFKQKIADLPPLVSVLANFYAFDSDGLANGLENSTMLHTFNKNQIYSMHQAYFDQHKRRVNAIIMGDMLGDTYLSESISYLKETLKIGYLNVNVDEALPQYLNVFDLVLVGDPSMDLVTVLLQELFGQ